jgi:hypothetical protein
MGSIVWFYFKCKDVDEVKYVQVQNKVSW